MIKFGIQKGMKVVLIMSLLAISLPACKNDPADPSLLPSGISLTNSIYYHIDLEDKKGDSFKVTGYFEGLSESNSVYQFPAVVPGTYNISDIGRFVQNFRAFDAQGNEIGSSQISTNQWEFSSPADLFSITYEVLDIWDNPVSENPLYRMGATSLEADHALINFFGVLGYPVGMKNRQYLVSISKPKSWISGTSLELYKPNIYTAESYDKLVDSPLLTGLLTQSEVEVDNALIGIYVYSAASTIAADDIEPGLQSIIQDASVFLSELPVDRYSFIFHFEDQLAGALEHSLSSVYVFRDRTISDSYLSLIKSTAAHEFFHIVTPLNIHSEIIADFNFAEATPSAHLWLYEGVTEWASDIMQYRNGSMDLNVLLSELSSKYSVYDRFDKEITLEEISLTSYTPEGNEQFINVYNHGALVAYMLDLHLLDLSNGSYGLRELILDLIEQYGPDRSFDDKQFFDVVVDMTYPEVETFINDYIRGSKQLNINEYFNKIGIEHLDETNTFHLIETPSEHQSNLMTVWSSNLEVN
ncbi:MAG: peptidase [Cyclobacteriaceae bacterium]